MEKLQPWQRVKEIVGSALERPCEERAAYLDQECGNNCDLRKEVESLLSAYQSADRLSELPWQAEPSPSGVQSTQIGPYHLLKEVGSGGMGQVWLAEQSEPVRRQVALKLIRAGMYDSSTVQRFKAERQSLAMMDHPTIAKVFDAGTTAVGQPYLVMEYVDGLPITDYCDSKKLDIRQRLQLLQRVCEGVQHAHQKAIIHRDLKPSNILVTEVDGKPIPRIIDFGLAKALSPQASGEPLFTQMGAFLGTPGYISPEQADPEVRDIDTRTDVYSLGVVLYELVTGFLPFDSTEGKKRYTDEMLRDLRESDPPRPSTKVSAGRGTATRKAEGRSLTASQLVRVLRGDLDWITVKALDRDRDRRYPTPLALASDLENYLQSRPVTAHGTSVGYRVRKYVRRHVAAVSVTAVALILLATFTVIQAIELKRITRERDRADRIAELMSNMFRVSDPSESRGNTVTAREILDKASKNINTGLSRDPELQASMLDFMGRVYSHLGLYGRSEELLRPALDVRRRVLGTKDPATLWTMVNLGNALADQGKTAEGDKLYEEAIEAGHRTGRAATRQTLAAMNNLAVDLKNSGRLPEAEKLQRDTIDLLMKDRGAESTATFTAISNLALTLHLEGHLAEAEKTDRHVLELRTRVLGADHPDTLRSAANLAIDLGDERGHDAEAESILRQTLEAQRRVVGPEHPDTLVSLIALAELLQQEGKLIESDSLTRQALEIRRRTAGPEHPRTLDAMGDLASIVDQEGNHAEAVREFRQVMEICGRVYGPESLRTLQAETGLSLALENAKQLPEAEKLAQEALAAERRTVGDENVTTMEQMYILANILHQTGHPGEAETLLRQLYGLQLHVYGENNPKTARSEYKLGAWAALRGDRDQALDLLRKALSQGLEPLMLKGIETDEDMASMRTDARFASVLAHAKQRLSLGGR